MNDSVGLDFEGDEKAGFSREGNLNLQDNSSAYENVSWANGKWTRFVFTLKSWKGLFSKIILIFQEWDCRGTQACIPKIRESFFSPNRARSHSFWKICLVRFSGFVITQTCKPFGTSKSLVYFFPFLTNGPLFLWLNNNSSQTIFFLTLSLSEF